MTADATAADRTRRLARNLADTLRTVLDVARDDLTPAVRDHADQVLAQADNLLAGEAVADV